MYIENLHAENVGLFEKLDVKFNNRFNFICGANGCGKTTLLRCIAVILNPRCASAFRYRDNNEIYVDTNEKYRIGLGKGWVSDGENYKKAIHYAWNPPAACEGIETLTINNVIEKNINFAPLLLGAYRRINYIEIKGMLKEDSVAQKRKEYLEKAIDNLNGGYLPNVKQWMINRYFMIDKSWAERYVENWVWLLDKIKAVTPDSMSFSFKEIKQDLEPVFTVDNKDCYLEELSAGFQAIMSLVLSIFEWIEATNTDDSISVKNATGTVCIDELDVHLHPEWQLVIRDILEQIFPKLQFIITTHSPHLIASAKSGELLVIPRHTGVLDITPSTKTYSGWSTDQILEEIMGVENLYNKLYTKYIKEALNSVENKEIEVLKTKIYELQKITHPSDTIIAVLKIKLAELEVG